MPIAEPARVAGKAYPKKYHSEPEIGALINSALRQAISFNYDGNEDGCVRAESILGRCSYLEGTGRTRCSF